MFKLLLTITLLVTSSCQLSHRRDSVQKDDLMGTQMTTKVKVTDQKQNKSYSAKSLWRIQRPHLLRLDILGPFDILLAQAFKNESHLILVDHRRKTITRRSARDPLMVDGYQIPINDLSSLFLDQSPRGWECDTNPESEDPTVCTKGALKSQWAKPDTLVLEYENFKMEIQVTERQDNPDFGPEVFQFVQPRSYQLIK